MKMSLFSDLEPVSEPAIIKVLDIDEKDQFLGHAQIEEVLYRAYCEKKMPHAVIFNGPRGVGKATFALKIIKYLLDQPLEEQAGASLFGDVAIDIDGTSGDLSPPSGFLISEKKETAMQVEAGTHPDFLNLPKIDSDKKTTSIAVADIREGVKFLRLTPSKSAWRCVLIDQAHEMTLQAQNSLLKVLEEPPKKTLLVLITDQPGKLLPTIKSRCRKYDFKIMADDQILPVLQRKYPEINEVEQRQILKLAQGSLGNALYFAKHNAIDIYLSLFDQLKRLRIANDYEVLKFCEKLTGKDKDRDYRLVKEFIILWAYKMNHYVMLGKIPMQIVEAENDFLISLRQYKYPKRVHDLWIRVLDIFDECERFNLDRKISLQNAMLEIHDVLKAV